MVGRFGRQYTLDSGGRTSLSTPSFMRPLLHFSLTSFSLSTPSIYIMSFWGVQFLMQGCHCHQLLSHHWFLNHLEWLYLPLFCCLVGHFQRNFQEDYYHHHCLHLGNYYSLMEWFDHWNDQKSVCLVICLCRRCHNVQSHPDSCLHGSNVIVGGILLLEGSKNIAFLEVVMGF